MILMARCAAQLKSVSRVTYHCEPGSPISCERALGSRLNKINVQCTSVPCYMGYLSPQVSKLVGVAFMTTFKTLEPLLEYETNACYNW